MNEILMVFSFDWCYEYTYKIEVRSFTRLWVNWGYLKKLGQSLDMPTLPFYQNFNGRLFWMDPVNIPAKFEVCSFTRSWDKRGYFKILGSPWIHPRSLFSKIFHGLVFGWTLWMYRPYLQSVALPVPEIITIEVLGWGCEPQSLGRGGLRESRIAPFERALVTSYRLSIVIFALSLRDSAILPLLCSSTPFCPTLPLVSPKKSEKYVYDYRVIELCRPPRFSDLLTKIQRYYGQSFALCFVLANDQVCLTVISYHIISYVKFIVPPLCYTRPLVHYIVRRYKVGGWCSCMLLLVFV